MTNFEEMSQLSYIKQIALDVADVSTKKYLGAKQNDINSRFLEIIITEELKPKTIPDDAAVMLRGTKANGNSFLDEGIISNGKIYVDLSSVISVAGRAKCDINLTDSKGSISTVTFYVEVAAQPFDEKKVIESEEFSALNVALVKVQEAINAYKIDKVYTPTSENAQSGIAVEQVAAELRKMIGNKVNTADMYTEEQVGCGLKGIFRYFENAKGGTSVELRADDEYWPNWEFTVCGANIVKPIETTEIGGVTFTKCDDGSIKIVGTATESSLVPVTEECTTGDNAVRVSGAGLYIVDYDNTPLSSIGSEGCVVTYNACETFQLAFEIEKEKIYNRTVYPMVTLGAGKKPFEPYKDYGKVYLPSDVSETTIFTFPEDGDYYIYDSWNYGECPLVCSDYTKKTANYIPEADRENFATVDELAEAQRTKVETLTTSLKTNTVYRGSINSSKTFVLPTDIDRTILNSIELQVTISNYADITIDLGTTKYIGDVPELSDGEFIIYYEHNGTNWCVGAINLTTGE